MRGKSSSSPRSYSSSSARVSARTIGSPAWRCKWSSRASRGSARSACISALTDRHCSGCTYGSVTCGRLRIVDALDRVAERPELALEPQFRDAPVRFDLRLAFLEQPRRFRDRVAAKESEIDEAAQIRVERFERVERREHLDLVRPGVGGHRARVVVLRLDVPPLV